MAFWDKYTKQADLYAAGQLPTGSRIVRYVRSTGQTTTDTSAITSAFSTTVAAALEYATAYGDTIMVLPGHSEAVGTTFNTNLTAGTRIVGVGNPDEDQAPILAWSGATDNIALNKKNVTIANMRLVADTNNVTEAITVTKAGFKLLNCYIDAGIATGTDILSFLNFSTNADDGLVAGCDFRCTAGGNVTLIKGGTVVDNLKIVGNHIFGTSQSTTAGNIAITAALTNLLIAGNHIDQQIASGTAAINFADVAATGAVIDNYVGTLADSTPGTEGILLAGTTNILVQFFNNYNSDGVKGTSGVLSPVVTS